MTARTQNPPLELPSWRTIQPRIADLAQTALRLALAVPFFKSGLSKWDGFLRLSNGAEALFGEAFNCICSARKFPIRRPTPWRGAPDREEQGMTGKRKAPTQNDLD